jgi:hypothetical protein
MPRPQCVNIKNNFNIHKKFVKCRKSVLNAPDDDTMIITTVVVVMVMFSMEY